MQFSLRKLFWIVLLLACAFAFIGGWNRMLQRARMTSDIVEPRSWPDDLNSLLSEFNLTNSDVDVRRGPDWGCYVWKMKSSPEILQAHINQYRLVQVKPGGPEAKEFRDHFPFAWEWPEHTNYRCFANPVGVSWVKDGEHLYVLIQDDEENMLYFYSYFNF